MSEYEQDTADLDRIIVDAAEREARAAHDAEEPPEEPEPVPPLEDPTKLGLGYYYGDGRYGDYWQDWSPYSNVYHAWTQMGYWHDTFEPFEGGPTGGWKFTMRKFVRRAHDAHKRIILALDVGRNPQMPHIDDVLNLMAPFWDRVWLVDLFDEPSWTKTQTEEHAGFVRDSIRAHGLAAKPLGITVAADVIISREDYAPATSGDLDWIGLETYRPATEQNDVPGEIIQRMKRDIRAAHERWDKQPLLIGQGYSRNGAWTNAESLRRLQYPTLELANELGALGIVWFAYGRPSGVVTNPALGVEHKKIARLAGLVS